MKPVQLILGAAAFALAACGQAHDKAPAAPAAPQSLMQHVQAQAPEDQLVTAYTALVSYQRAHPEATPTCASVRATESRGIVPANVEPDSIYAGHVGAQVYSIQCGALISASRFDPNEHWLVIYAPGATEVAVANCGNPRGDSCPRTIPIVEAAPTPTPAAAP